jgi:ribosomal-protein-alanine N-acetyltransferase
MALDLPIRTARLTLRDFQADDIQAVHAYASNAEVTRYMFYGPRTLEETRAYLEQLLASQRAQPRMIWELAVAQTADGRVVGACDLTLERDDEAELGFIFSREVWGLGYAVEAAQAMVRAGFEQLGVNRVFATCDVANRASARVLEKSGLRRESVLQKHKFSKNQWWSSFLYGMSRRQWTAAHPE